MLYVVNRCLVAYGVQCTACADACPHGAIEIGSRLEIHAVRCTECGACQRACPNEAIVVKELEEVKENRCTGLGGDIVCIAYFDAYVADKVGKVVYFCEVCPRGVDVRAEAERIKREIPDIDIRFERSRINPVRRRILTGLPSVERVVSRKPPSRIRRRQSCIEIRDDLCVYCGACFGVCPTGALNGDGEGGLSLKPDLCTGCELCVALCPTKALKPGRCIEFAIKLSERTCPICGTRYYGTGDKCPSCLKIEEETIAWISTSY